MSLHPHQERSVASSSDNPLQKDIQLTKRVKLIVYGDSGAGKSALALQFPRPSPIDLESGAGLCDDEFAFDVFRFLTAGEPALRFERVAWEV